MSDPIDHVDCPFFARTVTEVAHDLIGRTIQVCDSAGTVVSALLVETEAYGGLDDGDSHAAFRPGGRARMMWEGPGSVYVYAAYGVYPCFNIVTGDVGDPAAVLIRGVWINGQAAPVYGPGRTSRALGITADDHGEMCYGSRFRISLRRTELRVQQTPRVGVKRGDGRHWRYVVTRDTLP